MPGCRIHSKFEKALLVLLFNQFNKIVYLLHKKNLNSYFNHTAPRMKQKINYLWNHHPLLQIQYHSHQQL